MTCKDCIHYGICLWTQVDTKHKKVCKEFKNKADLVEVVRCKDCKFARKMVDGDYSCRVDQRIAHGENDFCSYGERK